MFHHRPFNEGMVPEEDCQLNLFVFLVWRRVLCVGGFLMDGIGAVVPERYDRGPDGMAVIWGL